VGEACRLFLNHERAKAMDYRFRIFEGADGQTYVTIQHANGQALYTSEGYKTRKAAIETLQNFIRGVRMLHHNYAATEIVARHTLTSTESQS